MGIAAYAASKAGAVGFIRHLAAETGRSGITVNALSLGTMNNWDSDALAKKPALSRALVALKISVQASPIVRLKKLLGSPAKYYRSMAAL